MGAALRLLPLLMAWLVNPAAAAPIDDAKSAYKNYKVSEAEALYRGIAADPQASLRDQGQAQTELARISWLIDGNTGAATTRLAQSLPINPEPCAGAFLYARILNDGGKAADVPRLLAQFSPRCADLEPGVPLEVIHSYVVVAAALPPASRKRVLDAARTAMAALPRLARAGLDAARLNMDIGLLAGDGHVALSGWKDYFWLDQTSQPQGFPASSAVIDAAFTSGSNMKSSAADADALARILARSGFASEVGWLATDHRLAASGDAQWANIQAYLAMRANLTALVLAHDRKYARDPHDDGKAFEEAILAVLRQGARAGGAIAGDDPWPALHDLWGLHGQIGTLNGVSGIMIGHAVEDRQNAIEQGARKGSIRYIALDNMIENSFSAWLWDGAGGPGGWAQEGTLIYQVRPNYARGTLKALAIALGGPARTQALKDAAEASRSDDTRAKNGVPVPLPGLGLRLRLQATDQVATRARATLTSEAAFAGTFRRLWWDLTLQSSIILHEGRHVLDEREYSGAAALTAPELEFRGKLSEIRYSDLARNALANVVGFEIDPASSHGQANARIIALYDGWIQAHASDVSGYRNDLPAGPQLDKLTDDQIRSIARSADPENGVTKSN